MVTNSVVVVVVAAFVVVVVVAFVVTVIVTKMTSNARRCDSLDPRLNATESSAIIFF